MLESHNALGLAQEEFIAKYESYENMRKETVDLRVRYPPSLFSLAALVRGQRSLSDTVLFE